jgi:SAM-dependent methyltransferase
MKSIISNFLDLILAFVLSNKFYFLQKGVCPCCEQNVKFKAKNAWLRDSFLCTNCNSIPRERALMLTIEKHLPDWKELKIHESSPGNKGASKKLQKYNKYYIASQYYPGKEFGVMVDGFRNEDLESQTFDNEIFDLVVTQDVFEHVYDPAKAFKEIARTLKKGGMHILTVPLVNKFKPTISWAKKDENGEPIFYHTPEYHFNPVDTKGSPVTMHWGYDIVEFIRTNSGLETEIIYIDNLDYGIRAEYNEVLISRKS